ncbi:MAG: hypothetical protein WBB67_06535, partial [bacterium]
SILTDIVIAKDKVLRQSSSTSILTDIVIAKDKVLRQSSPNLPLMPVEDIEFIEIPRKTKLYGVIPRFNRGI